MDAPLGNAPGETFVFGGQSPRYKSIKQYFSYRHGQGINADASSNTSGEIIASMNSPTTVNTTDTNTNTNSAINSAINNGGIRVLNVHSNTHNIANAAGNHRDATQYNISSSDINSNSSSSNSKKYWISGDASQDILSNYNASRDAQQNIRKVCGGGVKFIVLLRDPIERVKSLAAMRYRRRGQYKYKITMQ